MPRDWAQIEAAARKTADTVANSNTLSLPPGYIQGFNVTLRKDYTVLVSSGTANVGGIQVRLTEDHQLTLQDWVAPRIDTPQHYWIYLAKDGSIRVDIVQPIFNANYGYYEQPDYGWRAIGKLFVKSTDIIYAISDIGRSGRSVTVAPSNFVGYADYYCDGSGDQIIINAAINYVRTAYSGGRVTLLEGVFSVETKTFYNSGSDMAIVMLPNVTLSGSGRGTVIDCTCTKAGFGCISSIGITSAHYSNIKITGICLRNVTTPAGVTVNSAYGIYCEYTDNVTIDGNYFVGPYNRYVNTVSGLNHIITNNVVEQSTQPVASTDISCIYSNVDRVQIIGNSIHDVAGTGSINGIYVAGGAGMVVTSNLIYNLSTNAAASTAYGINVAANGYCVISSNKVELVKNSGTATKAYGIGGFGGSVSNSVSSNYCYNNGSDTGIANTNGNNFADAGTDTQVYSNSWQSPVSGEPSLGTLHEIAYANRSSTPLVNTSTNTAGVWSAAVTVSQAPVGAKIAWCMATITKAALSPALAVEAASGVTLSDVSVGSNIFLYQFCSPDSAGGQSWRLMPIPIDSNKQFKWVTTATNSSVTILAPVLYTL